MLRCLTRSLTSSEIVFDNCRHFSASYFASASLSVKISLSIPRTSPSGNFRSGAVLYVFSFTTSGPRRTSCLENEVAMDWETETLLGGLVLLTPPGASSALPFVGFKFFAAFSVLESFGVSVASDLETSVLIFALCNQISSPRSDKSAATLTAKTLAVLYISFKFNEIRLLDNIPPAVSINYDRFKWRFVFF